MLFSVFRLNVLPAPWKTDGDSAAVGMPVNLVGPAPSIKRKSVPNQGRNYFACGGIPKLSVIDRRGSDGHRNSRFGGDLDLIGRLIRDAFSVLKHAPDYQPDEFVDILERFVFRLAPG
jgi:hypothetical protein